MYSVARVATSRYAHGRSFSKDAMVSTRSSAKFVWTARWHPVCETECVVVKIHNVMERRVVPLPARWNSALEYIALVERSRQAAASDAFPSGVDGVECVPLGAAKPVAACTGSVGPGACVIMSVIGL